VFAEVDDCAVWRFVRRRKGRGGGDAWHGSRQSSRDWAIVIPRGEVSTTARLALDLKGFGWTDGPRVPISPTEPPRRRAVAHADEVSFGIEHATKGGASSRTRGQQHRAEHSAIAHGPRWSSRWVL